MYVCMYVCRHVSMYTCIYVCMYLCMYVRISAPQYLYHAVYPHFHTLGAVEILYTHALFRWNLREQTTALCACVCLCVHVCVHVCTHTQGNCNFYMYTLSLGGSCANRQLLFVLQLAGQTVFRPGVCMCGCVCSAKEPYY